MAIKSGFFNSVSGDRKYDAEDFNSFFDGVVTDGVLEALGNELAVAPSSGLQISVDTGKAWFLKSWIENTTLAYLTIGTPDVTYGRIDIVALDFDKSDQVRENDIVIVQGTPAASPVPPTLINTSTHLQMPLAHIQVDANETVIQASDITNKVGTVDCPYSTGITNLVVSVDDVTIQIVSNEISIKDGGVDTTQLAADAVTGAKIENLAVNSEHIVAGAIDNAHLAGGITGSKIANDQIDSQHYAPGSIDLEHMSANSVDSAQYVDGSIDGVHIANDQINSQHYAPGSIDLEHMSANSVDSAQYVDGSIDNIHLAGGITGSKIDDDQINSQHYAAGSIDLEHMSANSVDSAQYVDGSIDAVHLANNSVQEAKIDPGAVTYYKLGSKALAFYYRVGGSATNWGDAGPTWQEINSRVRVQGGTWDFGTVAGSGGTDTVSFAFPGAFLYTPLVFATIKVPNYSEDIFVSAKATASTMQLYVQNNSSASKTIQVYWMAFGHD